MPQLSRAMLPLLLLAWALMALAMEGSNAPPDLNLGSSRELNLQQDGNFVEEGLWSESKDLQLVIRLRLPGLPRFKNFTKLCHVARINLKLANKHKDLLNGKVFVCLHADEEMPIGSCQNSTWKAVEGGAWTAAVSPFVTYFLDVRSESKFVPSSDIGVVGLEEELWPLRVVFLALGLALVTLAPAMAACVPLYYSTAMLLSIVAVVIILLYQVTKLLPVGRRRALKFFFLSSLVGLGSVAMSYFNTALARVAKAVGWDEGTLQPVAVLALVGIILLGAGVGFWAVRKFVLGPEGRPNAATVSFVSAAVRVVGFTLLFLSSSDYVFRQVAVAAGFVLIGLMCWHAYWVVPTGRWLRGRLTSSVPKKKQQKPEAPHRPSNKSEAEMPLPPSTPEESEPDDPTPCWVPGGVGDKHQGSPSHASIPESQLYPSSIHRTRRRMARQEYEDVGQECTGAALAEMVGSPEFAKWARRNVDRLRVASPVETREEGNRRDEEIEETVGMEEVDWAVYKRESSELELDDAST